MEERGRVRARRLAQAAAQTRYSGRPGLGSEAPGVAEGREEGDRVGRAAGAPAGSVGQQPVARRR